MARRRGVLLAMTLILLAAAAAIAAPLAAWSGVVALESGREWTDLQHRLAVESFLAAMPSLLPPGPDGVVEVPHGTKLHMQIGEVEVAASVKNEASKLPLSWLAESAPVEQAAILEMLRQRLMLPALGPLPDINRASTCLEDWFEKPTDPFIYGTPSNRHVWSAFLSPVGTRINVMVAPIEVVEAALTPIRDQVGASAASKLKRCRSDEDLAEVVKSWELTGPDLRRYQSLFTTEPSVTAAVLARTTIAKGHRQQFLLTEMTATPSILASWGVAP